MKRIYTAVILFTLTFGTVPARTVSEFCNGWEFAKGPFAHTPSRIDQVQGEKWESVRLPHTWNAEDMTMRVNDYYSGECWYRKSFTWTESMKGKRVFLRFEGVGSCTEVYVNGKLAGTHKGAYSAFVCEIGNSLKQGEENWIYVKADNAPRQDVIPTNNNLFGVYGGIYRPVWIIVTDPCNISVSDYASPGVYISQNKVSRKSAEITVKAKLDNGSLSPEELTLECRIQETDGRRIAKKESTITLSPQGSKPFEFTFNIKRPHLWNGRKDPYLYRVVTILKDRKGNTIDEVVQPLGIRSIEIIAGKGFFLNGQRYPMYGVSRHQDWMSLGSALDNKNHDEDLAAIMEVGAPTIRLAHYQQSEYVYSRCDSLGLIVWAEIPLVNRITGKEWDNAHQQMIELVRQCYNHPSIYVWGIHNEVYQPYEYTSALTQSLHDLCKSEDPGRYTASVNGFGKADHPVNMNADIQGINRYFGWYEKRLGDFEPWIEGLEKDFPWMKMMLTEYGADANVQHQTEILGDAIDWTKPFYPETFQTLTHETHWSMIVNHPFIIASYLWNMFDFAVPEWNRGGEEARNMKGLITFDRKLKKDSFYWYKANWSEEPVLYITQRRNTYREHKTTSITVYSNTGVPVVSVNGKELPPPRLGGTEVHYIFDNVTLEYGTNTITAEVKSHGDEIKDEIEWIYEGERDRSVHSSVNKREHGGWLN